MSILSHLGQVSICKTFYTNFKLLPFKQAKKLPIIIGRHTKLELLGGKVVLEQSPRFGMILFGIGGSSDLINYESKKNYLCVRKGAKVVFKGTAAFATHTSLLAVAGTIEFGDKFSSNNGCRFSCVKGITFGDDCTLGGNIVVRDSDGHIIRENGIEHTNQKPVKVGDHVWIANNTSILKGVSIARNTVISYGSLVIKDAVEENAIYAGIPARKVKDGIAWEK